METPRKEDSPYYWWYEYLKRHKGYGNCCKRKGHGALSSLYEKFGNVHRLPFDKWWEGHWGLFHALEPFVIYRHTRPDFLNWEALGNSLLLEINLIYSKREIRREFNKLLREQHPGMRGRPKWDKATVKHPFHAPADYPLHSRPNIRGLERMLKVYDLRENTDLTLWEIGEKLKLNPSEMSTGKDGRLDEHRRRVMTALVSRYLRQAKAIISNTGKGIFPKK